MHPQKKEDPAICIAGLMKKKKVTIKYLVYGISIILIYYLFMLK